MKNFSCLRILINFKLCSQTFFLNVRHTKRHWCTSSDTGVSANLGGCMIIGNNLLKEQAASLRIKELNSFSTIQ